MNETQIKKLKKLSMMTLKADEEALLKRPAKDLSDNDIAKLVPLSAYKHWLNMAQDCIVEILHYEKCLKQEPITSYQIANLQYLINGQLKTVQQYLRRAKCYRQSYYQVCSLLKATEKTKAKKEADATAPTKKIAA